VKIAVGRTTILTTKSQKITRQMPPGGEGNWAMSVYPERPKFERRGIVMAVAVDVPVRLSGFLERGRPRPLNPPLMQTQLVFGLA
jgi:hypothetical protein